MTGIWRVELVNPYDDTVYDEKHRRKTFMESVRRIGINPRKAHKKRLKELQKIDKI